MKHTKYVKVREVLVLALMILRLILVVTAVLQKILLIAHHSNCL